MHALLVRLQLYGLYGIYGRRGEVASEQQAALYNPTIENVQLA